MENTPWIILILHIKKVKIRLSGNYNNGSPSKQIYSYLPGTWSFFSLRLQGKATEGEGMERKKVAQLLCRQVLWPTLRFGRKRKSKQKNNCGLLIHVNNSSSKSKILAVNIYYMPGPHLNIILICFLI